MAEKLAYGPVHAAIYPGTYEPMPESEKELYDHIIKKGTSTMKPPVNVSEMEHHYKVELSAPGFKTGDFHIHTNGTMVSIAACHQTNARLEEERFHTRSFYNECIEQQVWLPQNADTNFATAEYKDGILLMHFSKAGARSTNQPGRLIVY